MPFITVETQESKALEAFKAQVLEKLGRDPRRAFWECNEDFAALVSSDFLRNLGHRYVDQMIEDPTSVPNQWQVNHAVLVKHKLFTLTAQWTIATAEQEPSVSSHGANSMIANLGTGPVEIDLYRLPDVDLEVFDPDAAMRFSHNHVLRPREVITIDGGRLLADFKPQIGALLLVFNSAPTSTQIWSFDRAHGKAWSVSAAELEITQLKETLGILRRLGYRDAAHQVTRLCSHPSHDLRWEAIRTLGVLSPDLAKQQLEIASNDAHPHVRKAAQLAIASLSI